jgi:hypothetical protein
VGPNVRELRYVQRRLSPSEVAVLIADHEAGGWVGELAKLYGSTAPWSLPMSLGPEDLRPDRFLSQARAVCITEAFSALGIWGLSGPSDLAMERVVRADRKDDVE